MDKGKCEEQWRAIQGYEGLYEVSNTGRVRSLPRQDAAGSKRKMRYLRCPINNSGYPSSTLTRPGFTKRYMVHTLVAEAFIGPRPEGLEVNHIDGCKINNQAANLEYVSHKENVRHAWRIGLCQPHAEHWSHKHPERWKKHLSHMHDMREVPRGSRHWLSTLTEADIVAIRQACASGKRGSQSRMARRYGVTEANIYSIIKRKTWSHVA